MNTHAARTGPSVWWYLLAASLFAAGMAGPVFTVFAFTRLTGGGEVFLAPGSRTVAVKHAGRYVVWHKCRTMYEGRTYACDPTLPSGATITVIGPGGEVAVANATGASMSSGTEESHSVCEFEASQPGSYTVEVSGFTEPRVMMVRQSVMKEALGFAGGILLSGLACLLVPGAVIMAIIVAIMRWRAKKAASGGVRAA